MITVFSARNYAGTHKNDAAILLVSRHRTQQGSSEVKLQITPKVLKAAGGGEPQPFYGEARDVSPCRNVDDYGSWQGAVPALAPMRPPAPSDELITREDVSRGRFNSSGGGTFGCTPLPIESAKFGCAPLLVVPQSGSPAPHAFPVSSPMPVAQVPPSQGGLFQTCKW